MVLIGRFALEISLTSQKHYPDRCSDVISVMEFLCSFLASHNYITSAVLLGRTRLH